MVHLERGVFLLPGAGADCLVGSLAGASLAPEEACHRAGRTYDRAYRGANFGEYTRWFPPHDRCHAGYGPVPAWVNPALVVFLVLALLCPARAVGLTVVRLRVGRRSAR